MVPILLILVYLSKCLSYGYDAGSDNAACGKPIRTSREYKPPCDLSRESYCTSAGITYPWHAVRRFVRENQGLMKRMYGDQRHIAVLQAELDTNDFDEINLSENNPEYYLSRNDLHRSTTKEENSPRLLHDDPKLGEILNAKFVYSEQASYKNKINMPYFRPHTTQKTTETTAETEKVNVTTEINTSTLVYENITESTTKEEVSTESVITVDESTTEYLTSTEKVTEETSTETAQKKESAGGEVLFQDMEESSKKNHNQINYKLKGVNACPVKEEVVAPFWANNTRGEVLALLNLYPFEQYVHWEKCTYEHRQMYCREGCRCEQQYRLHRLLAYDPNNECRGIFSDWFRFPSCCVCKCYNIPPDFRVTSRSPRNKYRNNDINDVPNWFYTKNMDDLNYEINLN